MSLNDISVNLEFHYYLVYILAKYAGFSEYDCITIAYSSQYVDNNVVAHLIHVEGREYKTVVSQNYGFWSDWFPRYVYIPFHFFPGDISYPFARRKDGKTHKLNCTPGSSLVTELLKRALATKNLYRIGIALHTFADSWAHQNFTGTNDEWNSLNSNSPLPKVGHAEILNTPDILTARWIDNRLEGSGQFIDNLNRFLEAAFKIYTELCLYCGNSNNSWYQIRDKIKSLVGNYDEKDQYQQNRITNYIIEEELLEYNKYDWIREAVFIDDREMLLEDTFQGYDKLSWIRDQFLYKTGLFKKTPLQGRRNFFKSQYFFWQEAAKEHIKDAFFLLKKNNRLKI